MQAGDQLQTFFARFDNQQAAYGGQIVHVSFLGAESKGVNRENICETAPCEGRLTP
jgi:hypothetical protein